MAGRPPYRVGGPCRSPRKFSRNASGKGRMMMTQTNDLVLERTLKAPRELVWQAWTDPKHLKQWFAPKPYQISEVEMDLRPGGIFRIRMVGPDGFDTGHGNAGCVLEVVDG